MTQTSADRVAHTPGPWEAGEWNTTKGGCWVNAKDVHVCCVDGESKRPMEDARLIAAAPDMYAALVTLIHNGPMPQTGTEKRAYQTAALAIAKAEGRDQ